MCSSWGAVIDKAQTLTEFSFGGHDGRSYRCGLDKYTVLASMIRDLADMADTPALPTFNDFAEVTYY